MAKVDNPPAFPHVTQTKASGSNTFYTHVSEGMTLRDWFAGQVLAGGLLSAAVGDNSETDALMKAIAGVAYQVADAMLAARQEQSK